METYDMHHTQAVRCSIYSVIVALCKAAVFETASGRKPWDVTRKVLGYEAGLHTSL